MSSNISPGKSEKEKLELVIYGPLHIGDGKEHTRDALQRQQITGGMGSPTGVGGGPWKGEGSLLPNY